MEDIGTISEKKFYMWLDGLTEEKDLRNIALQLIKLPTENSKPFETVFKRLEEVNEQRIVLKEVHSLMTPIDTHEDFTRFNYLVNSVSLKKELKVELIAGGFRRCNNYYSKEMFLRFWRYPMENKEQILLSILGELEITELYDFCIKILQPLAVINTHFKYWRYSFFKIFLENKECIRETNKKYQYKSIFYYDHQLLEAEDFEIKAGFFNTILSYMETIQDKLPQMERDLVEENDNGQIMKYLKNSWAYYFVQKRLCSDLKIPNPVGIRPNIENLLLEKNNTAQLLKYWVHDLIVHFDFDSYCFYYFTLSLEERKIFNRRAKAKMKEEIKASMLKMREPWSFIEKASANDGAEIDIYSATWKSIWFGNGNIKICISKDGDFSDPFPCEFSEEKFNFLYEYLTGKRLKKLKVTAIGKVINKIEGLEALEELIWKIQIINEVQGVNGNSHKNVGTNRIPINILLRNQCIQYLNLLQAKELEPARILEKFININTNSVSLDVSLLYSIPLNDYEIAIIWESLELEKSKATHIFKCLRSNYDIAFSEIKDSLSTIHKIRSLLSNKEQEEINTTIKFYHFQRIEHDNFNFNKWKDSLHQALPEINHFEMHKS